MFPVQRIGQKLMQSEAGKEILAKLLVEFPMAVIREKRYGIVHKSAPIRNYMGRNGRLVWDYIVWNELTFEDESGVKISLMNSMSDEAAEKEFNKIVAQYGEYPFV